MFSALQEAQARHTAVARAALHWDLVLYQWQPASALRQHLLAWPPYVLPHATDKSLQTGR